MNLASPLHQGFCTSEGKQHIGSSVPDSLDETYQKSECLAILSTNQIHRLPLDIEGGGVKERDRLHPLGNIPSDVTLLIKAHLHTGENKIHCLP